MEKILSLLKREENWVQAPGSASKPPAKQKARRPPESDETNEERRKHKEAEKKDVEEKDCEKKNKWNLDTENSRKIVKILSDELLKAAPEKSEQVNELLKTKVEATLQARIQWGCKGGREGAMGASLRSKTTGNKRKFDKMQENEKELKGKDKSKRQEGCVKQVQRSWQQN